MMGERPEFALFPAGEGARAKGAPSREIQELWFSIARRRWASLVLVPAEASPSAGRLATALADVGSRLQESPVSAIVADHIDYASVRSLCDLQPTLGSPRWERSVDAERITEIAGPIREAAAVHEATPMPPIGRVIIAIEPVVTQPLGVAIAHAADAAVVCVEVGVTRAKDVRRTIELIGAERVLGAFLVR
jgi:hypothetical protein